MEETKGIQDEEIRKLMEQYFQVVRILKDDCNRRGIQFFGYGYFRKGDSIKNQSSYGLHICTELHAYDKYWVEKDLLYQVGL